MSNSESLKRLLVERVHYELSASRLNYGYVGLLNSWLRENCLDTLGNLVFPDTIYSINPQCSFIDIPQKSEKTVSFRHTFATYKTLRVSQNSASPTSFIKTFVMSSSPKFYRSEDITIDGFVVWDSLAEDYKEAFLLTLTTNTLKEYDNICIWLNSDLFYRTSLHKKIQKYVVEPLLEVSKEGGLKVKIIYTTSENIFNNIFHPVEVKKNSVYKMKAQIKRKISDTIFQLSVEKEANGDLIF
jgi:hypothetical protein